MMAAAPRRPKVFYGWWIVLGAFCAQALNSGLFYNGFGAFFLPILNEFGVSRATLSGAVALSRVEAGMLGPMGGWVVDRFGPRRIMFVGISIMGIGFLALAFVGGIVSFYLAFILLLALGVSLGLGPPPGAAVANWFRRKRGFALGIYISGAGAGSLMVPGVAFLITLYGWRGASIALAFAVVVLGFPLASLMRHRPEQYGMLPDGDAPTETGTPQGQASAPEADLSLREALRTRAFWVMGLAFAMRGFVSSSMGLHLFPALQGKGYSATQAGSVLALIGILSLSGRVTVGWLGDRFDHRMVGAVTMTVLGVSAIVLANAGALWEVLLFAVLYAPSDGGTVSNMFAMRSEYFGRKAFATIGGAMASIQVLGSIFGPLTAGLIYDVTGSYTLAFYLFSVIAVAAAALILTAKRPAVQAAPDAPVAVA